MATKRPALGRGLSALIPNTAPPPSREPAVADRPRAQELDIDLLVPNPRQPRLQMDDAKLEELAQSIRANGVIQPIVVRKAGDQYEIVAGERRWRASQRAGLLKVPVAVREVPDDKLLEVALIENIQRELRELRAEVREVVRILNRAQGSWKGMLAMGGFASAVAAIVTKAMTIFGVSP